jgi:hypothetical protein
MAQKLNSRHTPRSTSHPHQHDTTSIPFKNSTSTIPTAIGKQPKPKKQKAPQTRMDGNTSKPTIPTKKENINYQNIAYQNNS